jgi:hypothetical protein
MVDVLACILGGVMEEVNGRVVLFIKLQLHPNHFVCV